MSTTTRDEGEPIMKSPIKKNHGMTHEPIFRPSAARNLGGWGMRSKCGISLVDIAEESSGNLKIARNEETLTLRPSPGEEVTETGELERLRAEQARYDPARTESLEKRQTELENIIRHQRHYVAGVKKEYGNYRREVRNMILESCIADNIPGRDALIVIDRVGRIVGMTKKAERIYGQEIMGNHYSTLIDGTAEERNAVSRILEVKGKGWVYTVTKDEANRKKLALVKVSHKTFGEPEKNSSGRIINRYASIIRLERLGQKKFTFGKKEPILQDSLRKLKNPEEINAEIESLLEEAKKTLASAQAALKVRMSGATKNYFSTFHKDASV
jgi:PAS domain-containing protein